ncbi:VOC family protein [Acinetobacter haemolyticus]|uniref:VOC family protein n=1 Tax=Acinetobacter haemolyticus TaxID=29430 RepID=UPI00312CA161
MKNPNYLYLLDRATKPTVFAKRLTHLIFQRPDIELAERFLTDFGLILIHKNEQELFFRSFESEAYCYHVQYGTEAKFIGFGLEVESYDALAALTQIKQASSIQKMDTPGEGFVVNLTDPSGFLVQAIYGQSHLPELTSRSPLSTNYGRKHNRVNATQRPPISTPEVLRLGHVVLELANFKETIQWYMQHFGFIPSDVQVLPSGEPAVVFMRLNLGNQVTDHHTLAMAQSVLPNYSHSAFELLDSDAIGIGQRLLNEKGWSHAWGIGRHILGSQIFDYWNDPWHCKHEHYCDGDVFDSSVETGFHPVSKNAMSQWGPPMPRDFSIPDIRLKNLSDLVYHFTSSPDVNVKKIFNLAKIFL